MIYTIIFHFAINDVVDVLIKPVFLIKFMDFFDGF